MRAVRRAIIPVAAPIAVDIAIYARVSTERQERDQTIQSQLEACERYCAESSLLAPRRFVDDGVSGSDLMRPGLSELRDLARAGALKTIVAYDIDRLSRKLTHLLILMEEFDKWGVAVRFVRSPQEDSPEGRVLFNIKGVFAEYEREKIRERTLRGKVSYIRAGGWFGLPPYGYRVVKQHLEPDEAEGPWLQQMFSMYAAGACTLQSLADHLNHQGVRTRHSYSRREGWQPEVIHTILRRELYTGVFRREIKGIPESACEVEVPVLVDRRTFDRVQARLVTNRSDSDRNRIHVYLLSGLVRCGACGHNYHGRHVRPTDTRYYRCETNSSPRRFSEPCRNRGARAETLEAMVWDQVVELVTQPEAVLLGQRTLAQEAAAQGTSGLQEQLFAVRRSLGKIRARKSRLLDVLLERP